MGNNDCSGDYPIENITIVNNTFAHPGGAGPNNTGSMAINIRCLDTVTIKNNLFIDWGNSSYSYINLGRDVVNYDIGSGRIYIDGYLRATTANLDNFAKAEPPFMADRLLSLANLMEDLDYVIRNGDQISAL